MCTHTRTLPAILEVMNIDACYENDINSNSVRIHPVYIFMHTDTHTAKFGYFLSIYTLFVARRLGVLNAVQMFPCKSYTYPHRDTHTFFRVSFSITYFTKMSRGSH